MQVSEDRLGFKGGNGDEHGGQEVLHGLVQHGREEWLVEGRVPETLLEAVLARVGLVQVHFRHLGFARNEPAF